jgi:hypothetical protein
LKKVKQVAFYVILFLFLFAYCTTADCYDNDLWARLIVGKSIVQTGHVSMHDFLSYAPTHIWYDHEWGSSIIFYLTQHFWGSAGILILEVVLLFLIFFMITKVVELRGVNTTTPFNFLFYYFAFIATSDAFINLIRCQIFSFLFFTIFIYILEKVRLCKSSNKLLIWLPVIMLVWNNLHGGCVSGIGLIALYAIGEFLNRKPFMKYVYALLGTLVVLPINSWGFAYLKFLFMANTMNRQYITEWHGLFYKNYVWGRMKFKLFTLFLLLYELGFVIKQVRAKVFDFDKTKFLVVAATIYLAFEHQKLIPLAVIAMCCFFYDDFYTAYNALTRNFFNKFAVAKDTIIYILILIFATSRLNAKAFQPIVNYKKYPVVATEFIKTNHLKGNLLVSFGYGSYVSYKLYPNVKVFIDGRYEEVYYDFMLPMLGKFYVIKPGWDEVLKKYPPDIMIIEKNYAIYYALLRRKDYPLVYEDKDLGVFVKSSLAKRKFKKPSTDNNYYIRTVFDTDANFMLKSKND